MRILVTGSSGLVGRTTVERLERAGHEVVPFDVDMGADLRSQEDVRRAIRGVQQVVHLAAVLGWHGESEQDFMEVNLFGTWRLLMEAMCAGVARMVFVSSIDVLGVFKGHRVPDYLPLDDEHPCYPNTPYAVSKRLAEVLCDDAQRTHGFETVVLRPPGVFTETTYGEIKAMREARPSYEWSPFWEYGAFLDVRDLAAAIERALLVDYPGAKPFGLAADHSNSSGPTSRQWVQELHPDVEWRGDDRYETAPFTTLLDNRRTRTALQWAPAHAWERDHS
ncbi:MAG: UDP-glucose 4-epimerase [uncultured Acidimicrobiales bacterium]|uniref:UDP-glucose 4-epimerase n=1 Tax=uncultured Acidimicrobiales bacterium TaxID=310071 RepID=A0A6J4HQF2_9ACTN|nr:MAG: UDP-glucose 4-epimerase [uncultured Acidimicrobiales bacterium]